MRVGWGGMYVVGAVVYIVRGGLLVRGEYGKDTGIQGWCYGKGKRRMASDGVGWRLD